MAETAGSVQCQIEIPKAKSDEVADLTVGKIFQVDCKGDWPELKPDSLEMRLNKEDQYRLKLLKFESISKNEAKLEVTSYKAGHHTLKAVQLVDAEHSVVLSDLDFTVNSVIDPQNPPKQPYGPMGPFQTSISIWYPLSLLLLLVVLFGFILYRWKLRRDKRRLLEEMRLSENAQEPYPQFYQTSRKLQRSYSYFSGAEPSPEETNQFIETLGTAYKVYLARHFQVPTLKWSERKILSDLKKNHKSFYQEFRLEIRKALAEISRAQSPKMQMTGKDSQQLMDLIRKQIDQIETWVKGQKK